MSKMPVHEIPPFVCKCGYKANRSGTAFGEEGRPSDGDVSICFGCGRIWLFNDDLTMREPTEADEKRLMASEDWPKVQQARDFIIKKHLYI